MGVIRRMGKRAADFLVDCSRDVPCAVQASLPDVEGEPVRTRTPAGNAALKYPPSTSYPAGRIVVMPEAVQAAMAATDAAMRRSIPRGEIGTSGLRTSMGRVIEDYNLELQPLDMRMQRFEEMRRSDLAVMENMIGLPIREATWRLEGGDDENFRERLWYNLTDEMSHSFDEVLRVASLAPLFGFSIHELVHEQKWDGFEGLKKMPERSRRGVQGWIFDATGGVHGYTNVGFRPDNSEYLSQDIDIERLVLWTWRPDCGNPEGLGAFRQAWKPWRTMETLEEWAGMHVERTAVPIPIWTPPAWNANDADKDVVLDISDRMIAGENAGIMAPAGWTLTWLQAGPSDVPWLPLIELQHTRMLQGVLGHFVTYGTGGQNAGAPLGRDSSSIFLLNLNAIADWICETFNRYVIPKVWRWNIGNGDFLSASSRVPPKLAHSTVGLRDLDAAGRALRAIFDVNTIIPMETILELMELAGLAKPSDESMSNVMAIKEQRGRGSGANEQAAGVKQEPVLDNTSASNGLENMEHK